MSRDGILKVEIWKRLLRVRIQHGGGLVSNSFRTSGEWVNSPSTVNANPGSLYRSRKKRSTSVRLPAVPSLVLLAIERFSHRLGLRTNTCSAFQMQDTKCTPAVLVHLAPACPTQPYEEKGFTKRTNPARQAGRRSRGRRKTSTRGCLLSTSSTPFASKRGYPRIMFNGHHTLYTTLSSA